MECYRCLDQNLAKQEMSHLLVKKFVQWLKKIKLKEIKEKKSYSAQLKKNKNFKT